MGGVGSIANGSGISVSGPDHADAIVMLHMNGVNRHMWEIVVPFLDDNFRCVTVDLPGFGELADEEFTVDSATDRVGTVTDVLGAGSVALVGLSLGGYVAQAFAAQNPERVTGLLICGATNPLTRWRGAAFRVFGAVLTVLLPVVGQRATKRYADSLRKNLDPGLAEAIIGGGLSPRAGAQVFRRLPGRDYARTLAAYPGPIVVVNGEDDTSNRKSQGRFLELIPGAEMMQVAGAGHAVPLDRPEAFARAVRRLMDLTRNGSPHPLGWSLED